MRHNMEPNKILVTWENIAQVAETVVKTAQKEWGTTQLLQLSDEGLAKVYKWMSDYVHEKYLLPGDPSFNDLDDMITIALRDGD